jgi:pimeloyl-ACP methyl ester carboxylesterase
MTVPTRAVRAGGLTLAYRDVGSGPPVLLLHPGPGLDGSVFFPWFERLADRHRLFALDLPGNGRSEPDDPAGMEVADHARIVGAVAEALGLRDYTLLGHSFGSFVALAHAVTAPPRLGRVVASCSVASDESQGSVRERLDAFTPEPLREQVRDAFQREPDVASSEDCRRVWADQLPFFLADPEGPVRDTLVDLWRDVAYRVPATRWGGGEADYDVRDGLRALAIPVLAIGGRHDRATPPAASDEIAAVAPRGQAAVIEDAGHFPFAEQPHAYFAALEGFLAG